MIEMKLMSALQIIAPNATMELNTDTGQNNLYWLKTENL